MIIYILLSVNAIMALLYFFVNIKKGQKKWLFIFFLFVPWVGFLLYFVGFLVRKYYSQKVYDRESLVKRVKMEQMVLKPDTQKELNIMPIKDAMATGSNKEKRDLLLEQLKENMNENYRTVMVASADTDSESAHYVAAAKMEVFRNLYNKTKKEIKNYENSNEKDKYCEDVLDNIMKLIESDLLSKNEEVIYKKKYCYICETRDIYKEDSYNKIYLNKLCKYYFDLKNYEKLEKFWNNTAVINKTEEVYFLILKTYYENGKKTEFYKELDDLCKSNIPLSNEGLNMLRFWLAERKK